MRDCAIKNFAIQYIDLNSRNAEKIYKEALARGDTDKAKMFKYIFEVMTMYVGDLESRKQFLVQKKGMSEGEIAEAWHRHPTLMRKDKND